MEDINTHIIPTANPDWGFWGTSKSNDYNADLCWNTVMTFLIQEFNLKPTHARDVLDSRFGRHLADEFDFIDAELTTENINTLLQGLISREGWLIAFEDVI